MSSTTATAPAILEATGLTAGYGRVPVVRDVSLTVRPGEIVAILGANGAGKTTTLRTLSGDLPALGGEVRWNGEVTTSPLHQRARNGLSFVTENRSVIMALSAADNLRLAGVRSQDAVALFPELKPLLRRTAGLMSGGEQQMLTVARAILRGPELLLADELSVGLAPLVVRRLLAAVRAAATERGIGVVLVEQHVRQALVVADRAYVLQRGRVVLEGTAEEIAEQLGDVEAAYLSGTPARTPTTTATERNDP